MRESGGRGWGCDWSTEPELEEVAEEDEDEAEEARAGRGREALEGPSLMTEPTRRPSVTGSMPGTASGSMAWLDCVYGALLSSICLKTSRENRNR